MSLIFETRGRTKVYDGAVLGQALLAGRVPESVHGLGLGPILSCKRFDAIERVTR
jgi:hypothetical protein